MKAMVLNQLFDLSKERNPLKLDEMPIPKPAPNEILIKVKTCGVCHTELDEIEGRTPPKFFPIVLGHQVVGVVEDTGKQTTLHKTGERVGVAWIFSSCGHCNYCKQGLDNLCPEYKATGRDANGGYAEYMTVSEQFAFKIPERFSDSQAAPLLCAGAIGYRSLKLCGIQNGQNLGLTGFGASAHIVLKLAEYMYPASKIFVFARSEKEREFANELGAYWTGDTTDEPTEKLQAIIDTTPVWKLIVEALKNLHPGGRLVINAIRKENIDKNELLSIDYSSHLWMEKEIKSVANVSRYDVMDFLKIAEAIPIVPEIQEYPLEDANKALLELKERKIRGAKVLVVKR